jgi:hypothetical protein
VIPACRDQIQRDRDEESRLTEAQRNKELHNQLEVSILFRNSSPTELEKALRYTTGKRVFWFLFDQGGGTHYVTAHHLHGGGGGSTDSVQTTGSESGHSAHAHFLPREPNHILYESQMELDVEDVRDLPR